MPADTKKRPAMKPEPGEGKAHEMQESPEEEVREGSESEEGHYGKTSRKRSAKGAKKTKAPMDGEGCGCGGKKGATCDGNCGSSMKKRSDALTPQEYLTACDLGIQGRSRYYIRARLDTAERLDKKCGASGIAENKKCNVGTSKSAAKGSSLGTALKVIGTGVALGTAATVGTAMYQNHQRNMQHVKKGIKSAHDVRFKSNAGIRAAGLAAQNAVANAREGWKNPEVSKVLTEERAVQSGMQAIQEAKQRRTAAYSDTRRTLRELGGLVPESGVRRRRRERGASASSPEQGSSLQRRTRRQGRVTRMNSMYADGFAVNVHTIEV